MLNEIEASQLSDTEFKTMVIRKHNELMKTTKNYRETMRNLLQSRSVNMKKEIESINKSQDAMKNSISELKNTAEGIKRGLD